VRVCVCAHMHSENKNIGDITKQNAEFDRTAQTVHSVPSSDSTTQTNSELQKGIPIAEALCCGINSCN